MKKTVKTKNVVAVFNIIKDAKYSKMSDADKILIWKIFKAIKSIGTTFNEDVEDARLRLVPYDGFVQDLQRAQAFEVARTKNEVYDGMTEDEYQEFLGKFVEYDRLVNRAIEEFSEKEIEVDFTPITEEAFNKLRLSNDWTFEQADEVFNFVCEQ